MLVTRSRLAHDLDKLGLGAGGATMVHCRMSALGHVVGGAESVVRALLDALGPEGRGSSSNTRYNSPKFTYRASVVK